VSQEVVAARDRGKARVGVLSFEFREEESWRFVDFVKLRGKAHEDRRSLLGLEGGGLVDVCMGNENLVRV
jgi:hypothetical protein